GGISSFIWDRAGFFFNGLCKKIGRHARLFLSAHFGPAIAGCSMSAWNLTGPPNHESGCSFGDPAQGRDRWATGSNGLWHNGGNTPGSQVGESKLSWMQVLLNIHPRKLIQELTIKLAGSLLI